MADGGWDMYGVDWLQSGTQQHWEAKRCDCGCWVTYGENCPIEFHSWWCSLVRKE